jgi:hypothetical protein
MIGVAPHSFFFFKRNITITITETVHVDQDENISPGKSTPKVVSVSKKPYQKPNFRFERVFETMALSCGKLAGGGPRCQTVRKIS